MFERPVFIAVDHASGPDRTAEGVFRPLPDGTIELVELYTYAQTICLPKKPDGSFGDE